MPSELETMLMRLGAFRNILVHTYGTADDKLVYGANNRRSRDSGMLKGKILSRISNAGTLA